MQLRPDQIVVSYYPKDSQWSAPVGVGVLPPTEEFKPGDLVSYYDRPDCIGLVVARAPQEVEYEGISSLTKENIFRNEDGSIGCKRGLATIDFLTVVWNTGALRTAGAHMLHQLRHV